jgi:hypothetical protein
MTNGMRRVLAALAGAALLAGCGRGGGEPEMTGPPGEEIATTSPDAPMDTTPAGTQAPPTAAAETTRVGDEAAAADTVDAVP